MQEMLAYMLITGKTLEESHMYSNMRKSNARNGRLKTSYRHMPMDANMSIGANFLMVGKSKNTIH